MTINEILEAYKNGDLSVNSASYIGKPIDNTIMFISKKVEHLLKNLFGHKNCIVFSENGIELPDEEFVKDNYFIFSDNPQFEYAKFANIVANKRFDEEKDKKYTLTPEGYYLGENTVIGENSYIEPGCLIGHGVIIGKDARILAGAVIKNSIIGDRVIINEYAVIGSNGFTMSNDENGNKFRIPTLGKVIIGNDVEIGAHDNISCGSGGNTVLDDYVKIDALVHIGHDVHLHKNVEVTAGVTFSGFVDAGEESYIGVGSVLRNRISLGEHSFIGMGSNVTKSVEANIVVAGNPAKPFNRK